MNDDELDEILRALTPPKGPEELVSSQTLPVMELVAFAALALALLVYIFGALGQIFSV